MKATRKECNADVGLDYENLDKKAIKVYLKTFYRKYPLMRFIDWYLWAYEKIRRKTNGKKEIRRGISRK